MEEKNSMTNTTNAKTETEVTAETKIETQTEAESETAAVDSVVSISTGTYIVSGGEPRADGSFAFRRALRMEAESPSVTTFNRMTVLYTADQPVCMTAVYGENGEMTEDVLYLEAGENISFSFLITSYLDGKTADTLQSLSFSSCNGKTASFTLTDLSLEAYPVLAKRVYTLSGSRYDVGIKLAWGGGICSIIDRENTIEKVKNLVNQCDTGRLIQQSYYGCGANEEYEPGLYNGSTWAYNPVQGGNQYNQPSRLIDIIEAEGAVTVKTQPQDWSNRDFLTPSYMENTYTVFDDCILVDNRFVDFSGWQHGITTQEIPAFYTLSYFGTFVHYTGDADWSGDALSYERDLQFWGDSRYHADCDFRMRGAQTETWCAWVNETDDYGIGLYVPNCDSLLAGRFSYNGSKDALNGATNYVAPVNMFSIGDFTPVTYSYLITTGSVSEIRDVFTAQRDFADNASLKENYISMRTMDADFADLVFSSSAMAGALTAPIHNTAVAFDAAASAVRLTCTGDDPFVGIGYEKSEHALSAEDYRTISLTYMIPSSNAADTYSCELFLCAGETQGATGGLSVRAEGLIADDAFHTVEFDVSDLDFWDGIIHMIRLDYFDSAEDGDCIYIREIKLS